MPPPDHVVKVTISLPRSLHQRAKDRLQDFQNGRLSFSRYLQLLISSDVTLRPEFLREYGTDRTGRATYMELLQSRIIQNESRGEDDTAVKPYGDKKIVTLPEKRGTGRKVSYSAPKKQARR